MKKDEDTSEVWKRHFENMMNESMGGIGAVTSGMGIKVRERWPRPKGKVESC